MGMELVAGSWVEVDDVAADLGSCMEAGWRVGVEVEDSAVLVAVVVVCTARAAGVSAAGKGTIVVCLEGVSSLMLTICVDDYTLRKPL